jgi:hypothetical protein
MGRLALGRRFFQARGSIFSRYGLFSPQETLDKLDWDYYLFKGWRETLSRSPFFFVEKSGGLGQRLEKPSQMARLLHRLNLSQARPPRSSRRAGEDLLFFPMLAASRVYGPKTRVFTTGASSRPFPQARGAAGASWRTRRRLFRARRSPLRSKQPGPKDAGPGRRDTASARSPIMPI